MSWDTNYPHSSTHLVNGKWVGDGRRSQPIQPSCIMSQPREDEDKILNSPCRRYSLGNPSQVMLFFRLKDTWSSGNNVTFTSCIAWVFSSE